MRAQKKGKAVDACDKCSVPLLRYRNANRTAIADGPADVQGLRSDAGHDSAEPRDASMVGVGAAGRGKPARQPDPANPRGASGESPGIGAAWRRLG